MLSVFTENKYMLTRSQKKSVYIPIEKSILERVMIIPNRDELNNHPVVLIHEVFKTYPDLFHGLTGRDLISKVLSSLNDMTISSESFPSGYNPMYQCRKKVQDLCINPLVELILCNSGVEILSLDFDSKKLCLSTSISQQIRNDFVKLLISAFVYHKKSIVNKVPRKVDPNTVIHLSVSDDNVNLVKGAHNIIVRSCDHLDNAFIYK